MRALFAVYWLMGRSVKTYNRFSIGSLFMMKENSFWSLSAGVTAPQDLPGWHLRRERSLRGGYRAPGPT
eukprot:4087126-Alexandrium_andersonii.AAC.1